MDLQKFKHVQETLCEKSELTVKLTETPVIICGEILVSSQRASALIFPIVKAHLTEFKPLSDVVARVSIGATWESF